MVTATCQYEDIKLAVACRFLLLLLFTFFCGWTIFTGRIIRFPYMLRVRGRGRERHLLSALGLKLTAWREAFVKPEKEKRLLKLVGVVIVCLDCAWVSWGLGRICPSELLRWFVFRALLIWELFWWRGSGGTEPSRCPRDKEASTCHVSLQPKLAVE
jgi:hypothetical protein